MKINKFNYEKNLAYNKGQNVSINKFVYSTLTAFWLHQENVTFTVKEKNFNSWQFYALCYLSCWHQINLENILIFY